MRPHDHIKFMKKRGKKYQAAVKQIDVTKTYGAREALELAVKTVATKFDSTIELHLNLGIDTKKGEQQVRGTIIPPHSVGKTKRIAVFAQGKAVEDAKKTGAAIVGGVELIEEIRKTGKIDFDLALATPDMMKDLAKVAKVLGPRGLMPNPKSETVTPDIAKAMSELAKGKMTFKNDKNGNIHVSLGKVSLGVDKLMENYETIFDEIRKNKPEDLKGTFIKSLTIVSSMGPGIKVKA